jgi:hypothetical protein
VSVLGEGIGPGVSGGLDASLLVARSRSFGPWSSEHVVRLIIADGLGLILVLVGWWQAAGVGSVHAGIAWLNLCLAGLVVAAVGNGLWLLRARQAVGLARMRVLGAPRPVGVSSDRVYRPSDNGHAVLVAVPGLLRFHRPGCALVAGKQVRVASRVAHERAGRQACEVCEP